MAQGCSDCDAANETGNLLGESEGVASTSQGGGQLPVAEYFGGGSGPYPHGGRQFLTIRPDSQFVSGGDDSDFSVCAAVIS